MRRQRGEICPCEDREGNKIDNKGITLKECCGRSAKDKSVEGVPNDRLSVT